MDYAECLKKNHGYTDEMVKIDKAMWDAMEARSRVKIITNDDEVFIGKTDSYSSAVDEDDGIASISIEMDNGAGWFFYVTDIKSIEVIEE